MVMETLDVRRMRSVSLDDLNTKAEFVGGGALQVLYLYLSNSQSVTHMSPLYF